jgi:bifunctional non-homologous end joining protein LigD
MLGAPVARSRRGWEMTKLLPELATLPQNLVLDGELVALNASGKPDFPLLSERMLHGRHGIRVRLMVFDLLAVAGVPTLAQPYSERRAILDELELGAHAEAVATFDDGQALFAAVQAMGLEGIVAKR